MGTIQLLIYSINITNELKITTKLKTFKNIDEIVTQDIRWRKYALKIAGGDPLDADEILHRTYYNYMKMVKQPDVINAGYIHTALTNNFIKLINERNKKSEYNDTYTSGVQQDFYQYDREEQDHQEHSLYISVLNDISNLDMFHQKLFKLHVIDGISMREIERVYGLSFYTIQLSISNTKKLIKNKYI